jgi:hypothetical protein
VIEKDMLIVLSQDRRRLPSGKLRTKFANLHLECMKSSDYCVKGSPDIRRPFRSATVVEANLNDVAKLAIADNKPELATYDPTPDRQIRRSMLPKDLEEIDDRNP